MSKFEVNQGDSSNLIRIFVDGVNPLTADWTCNMYVVNASDTSVHLIEKLNLSQDVNKEFFQGFLTALETSSLPVGNYLLVYYIENLVYPVFPFKRSFADRLRIENALK